MRRALAIDMATILVVDDDPHIREVARFALARAGHVVELAGNGVEAEARLARGRIDLVVLDILMPELDGLSLCRRLAGAMSTIKRLEPAPAIVLVSSRGEEADRVLGLELGADDYLAKPFSPRELVARVGAVLRRTAEPVVPDARPPLVIAAVAIDRDPHEVRVHGAPLPVTATELRLLAALAQHRGRVLSRGQLIAAAYPDEHHVTERTIDTHVRNLRAKLAGADIIETVHGVGYRCA